MKTLASVILLVCSCLAAVAQGTVQFRNYVSFTTPPIDAPVYLDYVGGIPLSGTNLNYRAALLGGPNTASPWSLTQPGTLEMTHHPTSTTLTWVNFSSGTLPGQMAGYIDATGGNVRREIPGADWGTWALVQMVAWEGPYTSWVEAWQAAQGGSVRIGVSNPLTIALPQGPASSETYLWGLEPFAIQLVPEPCTTALSALALAAYIFARWRRGEKANSLRGR